MESVTAVVVTYNRKDLLKECLESILKQTFPVSSIIVIDNASSDGTREMLKNDYVGNKVLNVVRMKKNIGGAGGFYEGIKRAEKAGCDFVWIMDDDTIVKDSCLEELINASRIIKNKGDKASFFASAIYGSNGECMNVPVLSSKLTENGFGDWYRFLDHGLVSIEMATFVSVMVDSNAIRKCGLPCRDFFIWGDDSEYTLRLSRFFGDGFLVGKSIAVHKRKIAKELDIIEEMDDNRIEMFRYKYRNRAVIEAYYLKDIYPVWEFLKEITRSPRLLKSKKGLKKTKVVLSGRLEGMVRYGHFKKFIDSQLIKG